LPGREPPSYLTKLQRAEELFDELPARPGARSELLALLNDLLEQDGDAPLGEADLDDQWRSKVRAWHRQALSARMYRMRPAPIAAQVLLTDALDGEDRPATGGLTVDQYLGRWRHLVGEAAPIRRLTGAGPAIRHRHALASHVGAWLSQGNAR